MSRKKKESFIAKRTRAKYTYRERVISDNELTTLAPVRLDEYSEDFQTISLSGFMDRPEAALLGEHTLLLNGISLEQAKRFGYSLGRAIVNAPADRNYTYNFEKILEEALYPLSGREWFPSIEGNYYLCYEQFPFYSGKKNIRNAVEDAFDEGIVLEFGYKASRNGVIVPHVRRVNVVAITEDGFMGSHGRGVRRFKFSKVLFAATASEFAPSATYEPQVKVTFTLTDNELVVRTQVGWQGSKGGFAKDEIPDSWGSLAKRLISKFR